MRSVSWLPHIYFYVFLVLICSTGVVASDYEEGDSYTGVKLGFVGSGQVDIADREADQVSSLTGGVFFDLPFFGSPKI